jgi:RimJ/RimL family protein N-acetyltransferase
LRNPTTGGLSAGWVHGRQWERGDHLYRPLDAQDIESVRRWRNDQMRVLRQHAPLDAEQQASWYGDVVVPTHAGEDPGFLLFAMCERGRLVAYGGLTNVVWSSRRAEISFLAETALAGGAEYDRLFAAFLTWVVDLAFGELGLHRLFAETYAFRTRQIAVLAEHGFTVEGTLRDHVCKDGRYADSVIQGRLSDEGR